MALKFLNKKGWHTGSLRNIENVWKAEQKHEAEQRKVEELRKQIHDERERERDAFRQIQEQAGLVPRRERLDFLYESGWGAGVDSKTSMLPPLSIRHCHPPKQARIRQLFLELYLRKNLSLQTMRGGSCIRIHFYLSGSKSKKPMPE